MATIRDVNFLEALLYSGLDGEYFGALRSVVLPNERGGAAGPVFAAGEDTVPDLTDELPDGLATLAGWTTSGSGDAAGGLTGGTIFCSGFLLELVTLLS